MYSKCTFRYVPKIAEVRGQGVGNFPLNYTEGRSKAHEKRCAALALHQRPIKYTK